jgi:hypothetical protein
MLIDEKVLLRPVSAQTFLHLDSSVASPILRRQTFATPQHVPCLGDQDHGQRKERKSNAVTEMLCLHNTSAHPRTRIYITSGLAGDLWELVLFRSTPAVFLVQGDANYYTDGITIPTLGSWYHGDNN